MHILLINQFYPPDPAPTGQFLHNLATALADRGHRVRVICSRQAYAGDSNGLADAAQPGVRVVRLPGFGFGRATKAGRFFDYLSYYTLALLSGLFGSRPDVVVCLTTPPYIGFIGVVLRLVRRARFIQWVMDLYPDVMVAHGMLREGGPLHWVFRRLTRSLFGRADAVWALGPYAKEKIAAYVAPAEADKIEVVPLWADGAVERGGGDGTGMKREYECAGRFVVMYSGNLGLGHDFETLLQAARVLGDEDSPTLPPRGRGGKGGGIRFLFVGGGTQEKQVKDRAAELGLANVDFRPYAERSRLAESLAAGDVHIVSQLPAWQGSIVPSKLAGIFAAGRPAILIGGERNEIAEWIRQAEAGYVVGVGNVEGLCRAIEALRGDPALRERMGRNARSFYEANLAAEKGIRQLVESLERVVARDLQKPVLEGGLAKDLTTGNKGTRV